MTRHKPKPTNKKSKLRKKKKTDQGTRSNLNDFDNGFGDSGGGAFGVVATRNDAIEELSTFAKLHNEMNGIVVLIGVLQRDDIGMLRQVAHDLNLPPDILDVDGGPELLLGNGLAGKFLAGLLVRAEVGDAELAPAQLAAQLVTGLDLAARGRLQNGELGAVGVGGVVKPVIDREGVLLFPLFALLVPRFLRGRLRAADTHLRGPRGSSDLRIKPFSQQETKKWRLNKQN